MFHPTCPERGNESTLVRILLPLRRSLACAVLLWSFVPAAWVVSAGATLPADVRGLPTLAPMLAQVTPAVVNIAVAQAAPETSNPLLRDPVFRHFFGIPDSDSEPDTSAGSGVIIDAQRGLVVTNHHVVDNAQEIVITLKDRRQVKAELVGSDPATDVALLRIHADRLTALHMADSDALSVGDFVVAIGNPFGIGQTVTSGIVSALGRSGLGIEGYEDFIQTDASINPGNSGGALVNLRGELVGINTAILGPTQGNVGIGFAIPANMVSAIIEQLLQSGEVRRGRVGLTTSDVTPDTAEEQSLPVTEGALVEQVDKDSPAALAHLQTRDVIIAINGHSVRTSSDLRNRVGLTPAGDELELKVNRAGKVFAVKLRVAEAGIPLAIAGQPVRELAGARIANIEAGTVVNGTSEGAVVTTVERGSAAFARGLRGGDVIYGINRRRVRNTDELLAGLKNVARPWRLMIVRGDSRIGLMVP
jgi:Do/DeqQ family serine protease